MATLTPDAINAALDAVHKSGMKAGSDPSMATGGAGPASGGAMTADPAASSTDAAGPGGAPPTGDPSLDPNAQGAGDPTQQAVWTAFPGTDPGQMQSLMGGGDMQQAIAGIIDAQAADVDKLNAMHKAIMEALLTQTAMPDASQSTVPPPGPGAGGGPGIPGVGGDSMGYS